MRELLELLRRLGDALLELAGAEFASLSEDLRRGSRQAARAIALVVVGVVLAALAWALFTLALVWGLANVIAAWQAALAVGALYAIVAIVCGATARKGWRQIEAPGETVKRHVSEQGAWFRDRVLALPAEQESPDGE